MRTPFHFFLLFGLVLSLSVNGQAQTTWKSAAELPVGKSLKELGVRLPLGADEFWLERMTHRGVHREAMHLPENTEPSNFGGYTNLIQQDVRMKFDPQSGWIEEELDIVLEVNKENLEKIPVNFPASLDILNVVDPDGVSLDWESNGGTLILLMDPPPEPGTNLSFTIVAEGGFSCPNSGIKPCAFGSQFSYLTHAEYYVQGSPIAIDMFRGSLEIEVPEGKTVIATGRFVESYAGETGTVFRYWHDYETIFFSFAVADYVSTEKWMEGIPVRVHTLQADASDHGKMHDLAEEILAFYNDTFQPFPFHNLDMVQMDGNFGGGYGPQATVFMYQDVFSFGGGRRVGWRGSPYPTRLP